MPSKDQIKRVTADRTQPPSAVTWIIELAAEIADGMPGSDAAKAWREIAAAAELILGSKSHGHLNGAQGRLEKLSRDLRRLKDTPIPLVEAVDAVTQIDPSLPPDQQFARLIEIICEAALRLHRKDA